MDVEIYKESPNFTEKILNKYTVFKLKGIAKRFGLINKILDKQKDTFK